MRWKPREIPFKIWMEGFTCNFYAAQGISEGVFQEDVEFDVAGDA